MFVWVSMEADKGIESPRAGVTAGSELPGMGAGN